MKNQHPVTARLKVGTSSFDYYPLGQIGEQSLLDELPFSIKILLENLLRHFDGENITDDQIQAITNWGKGDDVPGEIAFTPARVVLQDFTGVPAIVDLAAMRDAIAALGGDPQRINPLAPVELVIDHSVQVDAFGSIDAQAINVKREYERNHERYRFLRWGQDAFKNFRVVPPGTGIVHQVNLEHLARVVFQSDDEPSLLYPDTLVGTDSHTTMINGLGVLGWGVGGIEAEAAMLGQPVSMLVPKVVGVRMHGKLPEGTTATDLVLRMTELLREHGVVGKFVEFFGDGLSQLPVSDRATISNMSPEFGATCAMFPIDAETLRYLALTGRPQTQLDTVEAYARAQGLWREDSDPPARYTDLLELDLNTIETSIAGPRRPQDRIALSAAATTIREHLTLAQTERSQSPAKASEIARFTDEGGGCAVTAPALHSASARVEHKNTSFELSDGAVVIAAITSCTNTSNPSVMIAAGLLARAARRRGLSSKPWVKTSLAPGSKVVTDYLQKAGLLDDLAALGFDIVGYGCTTCIGNSGPLPVEIADAVRDHQLIVSSVLSGNRNFEGRIHPDVRMNFLASPPLVVAYALAGTMTIDLQQSPLGTTASGDSVYLAELWPDASAIAETIAACVNTAMFRERYADVFTGDEQWAALGTTESERYAWDPQSSYIRQPPFFNGLTPTPDSLEPIRGARVLCLLGDSVTTDHISPAGSIMPDSPAGIYLCDQGITVAEFNSYGSRRGSHEVMMRGTFANVRLRNHLAPGTEGGWTRLQPDGDQMPIFNAAETYARNGVPLLVIAGRDYGSGSSRDWAAKGPRLLGVRAVIAQSYERIHRSNLIGMGVLPLQFADGENVQTLGLSGGERFDIEVFSERPDVLQVNAQAENGAVTLFNVDVRIDTPKEWEYFRHGGILNYVLRELS